MQRVARGQSDEKTTQLHEASGLLHVPWFLPLKSGIPGLTFLPCTPRSHGSGKIFLITTALHRILEKKGRDVPGRLSASQSIAEKQPMMQAWRG